MSEHQEYWRAEMAKAERQSQKAKTKAAARKANMRMMECRMAMRQAMSCGGYES